MATQFYKASQPVQVGGIIYPAGEPFAWEASEYEVEGEDGKKTTEKTKPGKDWEKVSAKDAAVQETATNAVPDDADLEALTKAPLQAVAFMRHVQGIADLDVDGLKAAIRASYEPKL